MQEPAQESAETATDGTLAEALLHTFQLSNDGSCGSAAAAALATGGGWRLPGPLTKAAEPPARHSAAAERDAARANAMSP